MKIAEQSQTRIFLSAFEISAGVRFLGCNATAFKVAPEESASDTSFAVYYPTITSGYSTADYSAPIGHEISHIFQVRNYGGLQTLRQRPSLWIELDADFLCGLIYKNYLHGSVSDFQENINLMGRYRELSETAHGTPQQRTVAFRRGYYLPFDNFGRNIAKANDFFQSDIFGQIT